MREKKVAWKTYIILKGRHMNLYSEYKRKRKKVKELIKASKNQTWGEFGEDFPNITKKT